MESFRVLVLSVAYDGTRFKGWQRQSSARTVQAVVEEALSRSLGTASGGAVPPGSTVEIVGAGRTDAGVHAEGQVASVSLPGVVDPGRLLSAVNAALPRDVQLIDCRVADERFHARYRAVAKTYRYTVVDGPVGDPFLANYGWRVFSAEPLDEAAMMNAAAYLVGRHDFSAFTADKNKKDKTRELHSVDLRRRPGASGGVAGGPLVRPGEPRRIPPLDILFRGDGFLWNQVRIMASILVSVGSGDVDPERVGKLLESRNRALAPAPAPACGLTLVSVEY